MKPYIFAAALAALCLCQCTVVEDEPLVYDAPVAEFPSDIPQTISLNAGDSYTFSVNFTVGESLTKEWRVNGVLESSSDKLTYQFDVPGEFTVTFRAYNGSGSVEHSYTVKVSDKLEIGFSVGDSTVVSRMEESYLKLYAIVKHGEDVKHSWSMDGVEKSTEAYFEAYIPKNVSVSGDEHTVTYTGTNAVGSFTRTFTVKSTNRPLQVKFDERNSREFTYTVNISAEVLYGGEGVQHKWYVDDALVSEADEVNYVLSKLGTHSVKYYGINAKGETVEKEWSVDYDEYIADFNAGSFSNAFQIHNTKASNLKYERLEVVDSPYEDDGQGKVLKWQILDKNGKQNNQYSRGGIIILNDYLRSNGIDIKQFKGIKLRGRLAGDYLGDTACRSTCVAYQTDYSVEYDEEYSKVLSIRLGSGNSGLETRKPWNYVCKSMWVELTYDVDFSEDGTLKIYPVCTVNTTDTVKGYSATVYFDDIVLF